MIVHRLRNWDSYKLHRQRMGIAYQERGVFERSLQPSDRAPFTVPGFSYPAGEAVQFTADFLYAADGQVNWRERLVCPITGLNNRLRAVVHLAGSELGLLPYESIYITEQVTPLYDYLQRRYPAIVGSEYLGESVKLGGLDSRGVRNEDLTQLTFRDESFDVVLSFDCFEHMPDFPTGMREMARVTKVGGRMLWSVPFRADRHDNLCRASLSKDGTLTHHEPPEYHGDPLSADGCLCYTHFGWEMLDQVRQCGFSDAYAVAYWSDIFGYLGVEQFMFVAIK